MCAERGRDPISAVSRLGGRRHSGVTWGEGTGRVGIASAGRRPGVPFSLQMAALCERVDETLR